MGTRRTVNIPRGSDGQSAGGVGVILALLTAIFLVAPAAESAAQSLESHTLFVIATMSPPFNRFPLNVYSISGLQITFEQDFRPDERATGPIGLAVDPIHEYIFLSHENLGTLDVLEGRTGSLYSQIPIPGATDLAGMDFMDSRGRVYLVDRGEPDIHVIDTDTLTLVDTWELPNGYCLYTEEGTDDDTTDPEPPTGPGAYDVHVIADLDGRDVIFVANGLREVCWFDLDTHEEVGGVTLLLPATGIAVDNSTGSPIIYATAASGAHGPDDHDYLIQHHVESGAENRVDLGGDGRGVDVSEDGAAVFVVVGGAFLSNNSVRVFDTSDLRQTDRENLTCGLIPCSPTDLEASWLSLGARVEKTLSSHPGGEINSGEELVFSVTITNESSRSITKLPLRDEYDRTHLHYISSNPASNNNMDDGRIDWTDLTNGFGSPLLPGQSYTVEVRFTAEPDPCPDVVEGVNVAHVIGARDDLNRLIPDSSGRADYRVICGCSSDEDCSDDVFCNGEESCVERECLGGDSPCADDGDFCNGDESCNEATDACDHSGDPCADDGDFCNGEESCDEADDQCTHSGDPCVDDGLWCNGDEYCDEDAAGCLHTGGPCQEGYACDEDEDECVPFNVHEDDDEADDDESEVEPDNPEGDKDEDAGWPEGKVTGGCCGCDR